MKKLLITILIICFIGTSSPAQAYWVGTLLHTDTETNTDVFIGEWQYLENMWDIDYNLNIWEEEETLNQRIPEGVVFSYDNLLYTVREGEEYNPHWHGVPSSSNKWAFVSLELEWRANTNYRTNSVVVRDGRYFIANHNFNDDDWFINDPLIKSGHAWSEWREIEPLLESDFGYIEGTTLIDYRMSPNEVVYK